MVGFSGPTVVLEDRDFSGQANTGDGISDCQVPNFQVVRQNLATLTLQQWVEIQLNKGKSECKTCQPYMVAIMMRPYRVEMEVE